ncbi:helix-turn-helix transcriptional regulator [Magnetospirillum fulvum]|uniref:Transcriptional regulator, AraC family n=1 Tax=Magnetospirillum fulvum TaxID=1082 RepID=A0A1H6HJI9_MAGFU|nr:AraC family transcriptional regulator [Magnetospirillum fulvum]SEH35977.1 transcriptional regulator, AraC family [Magnetospirillum fulvum]
MVDRVCHRADESGEISSVRVEGDSAATPWHAHLSLVLGLVDRGHRTLHLPSGPVALGPGDGFVIPPDTPHAWAAGTSGQHRVLVLGPRLLHDSFWAAGAIRDPAWTQAFDRAFARVETGGPLARAEADSLLGQTSRLAGAADGRRLVPGPLRMARREAVEQVEARLDLTELARRVGLSPFHLHRLYRRTWGLTPAEHRLEARLRHARTLILQGTTIADAAAATGFADQSHFSRAFRRLMGVPPGMWARQIRPARRLGR